MSALKGIALFLAVLAFANGATVAPGNQHLQTVVDQLVQRVTQLEAEVTVLKNGHRRVAFSAMISSSGSIHAVAGGVIVFNSVIDNVGNGYNPATGEFTAPVDGDYFFIVNCDVSEDYEGMQGYVSGRYVFKADKDDWASTHAESSVVVKMTAGDVLVMKHTSSRGTVDEGHESILSGFLIQ